MALPLGIRRTISLEPDLPAKTLLLGAGLDEDDRRSRVAFIPSGRLRRRIYVHHACGTIFGRTNDTSSGEAVAGNAATVALSSHNGRAYLQQIRGPCNTKPSKAIVATVVRWLHAQGPLPPCQASEWTLGTDVKEVATFESLKSQLPASMPG